MSAITKYEPRQNQSIQRGVKLDTFEDMQRFCDVMHRSGVFKDIESAAQAMVKIQYGLELGLTPMASIQGVHFIKGKPCLSSVSIAALIERSGVYTYKIREHSDKVCVLEFSKHDDVIGESSFSTDDARKAGLTGEMWNKYARNMLFARAISNGARWYCASVFGGAPVYTPEEMREADDGDRRVEVIEHKPVTTTVEKKEEKKLPAKRVPASPIFEACERMQACADIESLVTATREATTSFESLAEPSRTKKLAMVSAWSAHLLAMLVDASRSDDDEPVPPPQFDDEARARISFVFNKLAEREAIRAGAL